MQCIHLAVQICRLSYKSTQTFVTFGVPNLDVHLWLQIGLYHTTCCCHRQCDGDRQHKALRGHNGDQSHDHKFLENLHPNVSASAQFSTDPIRDENMSCFANPTKPSCRSCTCEVHSSHQLKHGLLQGHPKLPSLSTCWRCSGISYRHQLIHQVHI